MVSHLDSDLDQLHRVFAHELILIDVLPEQLELPMNMVKALRELCYMVSCQVENQQ